MKLADFIREKLEENYAELGDMRLAKAVTEAFLNEMLRAPARPDNKDPKGS